MENWPVFFMLLAAFILWATGLKREIVIYEQTRGWLPDSKVQGDD